MLFCAIRQEIYETIEQIRRVGELSDTYHLQLGQDDVMVMYLLEATWKRSDRDA